MKKTINLYNGVGAGVGTGLPFGYYHVYLKKFFNHIYIVSEHDDTINIYTNIKLKYHFTTDNGVLNYIIEECSF